MNRYRAKQISYYDERDDEFIIQKRFCGIFWIDYETRNCNYYTNLNSAYLMESYTPVILNNTDDVMNVLKWLESDKNHNIFICSDKKYKDKVIYGISLMDKCYCTWNAALSLNDAEKVEKKLNLKNPKHNISHIIIWKHDKKTNRCIKSLIKNNKKI